MIFQYLVFYIRKLTLKKIASIFLIALFLFNLFGYTFVFDYMQLKTNDRLELSLDNHQYDDSKLIEFKVPMNLPYQTRWSDYQRCDGEIEVDGILYKYVKRKVANDTLYVMCIPNTKVMHLETVKNDLIGLSNGLIQNGNSQLPDSLSTNSLKQLQSAYDDYLFAYHLLAPSQIGQSFLLIRNSCSLIFSPRTSPEQPPDILEA